MRLQTAIGTVAAGAAALYTGPSWAGAGASLAAGLLGAGLTRAVRARLLRREIAANSRTLETAYARVHRVSVAPAPKRRAHRGGSSIEDTPNTRWRYVDVTVHIPEPTGRDQPAPLPLWAPGLLKVVGPGAQSGTLGAGDRFGEDWSDVVRVDIMQGGNWEPVQADKVIGSQRLRLLIGVPAGHDQFKLRYGFVVLANGGQATA